MIQYILILLSLGSCTLFNKEQPKDDELVELTDDVLKKGEGVEIDVKPISKSEKK